MSVSSTLSLIHMRKYLWGVIESRALAKQPSLEGIVLTSLRSSNPNWISRVYLLVRVQDLRQSAASSEPVLFREPRTEQLRGRIFLGHTIPGGHEVWLPLKSFGQRGHMLVTGATGTGKSVLLNLIALQLMVLGVPVVIYDILNQAAPFLIPLVPPEKLGIIDLKNYRRNPLIGPLRMSQMDWIRMAADHLMESLRLEPVTMNALVGVCERIISGGNVASVPQVIEALNQDGFRSPSHRALLNRLLPLTISGLETFACERGPDLDRLFAQSFILNLQDANSPIRRLIHNDHYLYRTASRDVLKKWQLKTVYFLHEAGRMVSRSSLSGSNESVFIRMIAEARNFGIGFCFADQVPQAEHETVRSNIGTRIVFRLEDQAAVDVFRTSLRLTEAQKSAVMNLPDRHALVRRPDVPFPFLVRIPDLV